MPVGELALHASDCYILLFFFMQPPYIISGEEKEKKDMIFRKPVKRRLSRFFVKILPRRVWRFWRKPEGLDLY